MIETNQEIPEDTAQPMVLEDTISDWNSSTFLCSAFAFSVLEDTISDWNANSSELKQLAEHVLEDTISDWNSPVTMTLGHSCIWY